MKVEVCDVCYRNGKLVSARKDETHRFKVFVCHEHKDFIRGVKSVAAASEKINSIPFVKVPS